MLNLAKTVYRNTFGRFRRFPAYRKAKLFILTAYEAVVPPRHDGHLIPPPKLRQLTTLNRLDVSRHINDGIRVAGEIEEGVRLSGNDAAAMTAVLEFGCGCGRVLRHLKKIWPHVSLYGTDVDPTLIKWSADNLGDVATFSTNGYAPPLDFDNDSLDAIYLVSVFTHLDEDVQLKWLEEFHRVLKPGGLVLVTIVKIDDEQVKSGSWDFVNDAGFVYGYRRVEITKRSWVGRKAEHPHYIDAKHTLRYCQTAWSHLFSYVGAQLEVNGGTQTLVTLRKK